MQSPDPRNSGDSSKSHCNSGDWLVDWLWAYPHKSLLYRVTCSTVFAVICLAGLEILFPRWTGDYFLIRGPLWLLSVRSDFDKMVGVVVAAVLLPIVFAFFIHPRLLSFIASAVGIALWLAFGLYVSWLAAV